jgi:hypothetical protein
MLGHARFSRGAAMAVEPTRMKGMAAIADFMVYERFGNKVMVSDTRLRFVLELSYEMLSVYLYHSLTSVWQLLRLFGHMDLSDVVLC